MAWFSSYGALGWITNFDWKFRQIYHPHGGKCHRFYGAHDTLTSWDDNGAYQYMWRTTFYKEFLKEVKRIEKKEHRKMTRAERDDLRESYEHGIMERLVPQAWEMFLECITAEMHHINYGTEWSVTDLDNPGTHSSVNAHTADHLLGQIFSTDNVNPTEMKENVYFVWRGEKYHRGIRGGIVIQRYFGRYKSEIRWVIPAV
jgi:hypothetical protein